MKIGALLFITFLLLGCQTQENSIILKVDLSNEHDAGRFVPEDGDRLMVVGAFNDWEPGVHELTDPEADWRYEIKLGRDVVNEADTLSFKFVIVSEQNRDLPNSGWEIIPNRSVATEQLEKEPPVFVFNESWSPMVTKELTFRVNMSNQQVLGFFDPEEDRVMVSGTFSQHEGESVELDAEEGSLVYSITFPVEVREEDSINYQYKIESGSGRLLPDNGWEFISPREYDYNNRSADFFNDQLRVLRVIVSKEWISRITNLGVDDRMYVQLQWNGNQSRNYRMEEVSGSFFEVSIQVPESMSNIICVLKKNFDDELYESKELQVGLSGRKIDIR